MLQVFSFVFFENQSLLWVVKGHVMWSIIRAFLLLGFGYFLAVAPSLNQALFQFQENGDSSVHPGFLFSIAVAVLLVSFYVISIPLAYVAKGEKKVTERYLANNKSCMSDYLPRRGSF